MLNPKNKKTIKELLALMEQNDDPKSSFGSSVAPPVRMEVYYDKVSKYYYMRHDGHFIPISRIALWGQLAAAGWDASVMKGESLSPADCEILRIQREHHVDFVGPIAGRKKGFVEFSGTRCLILFEPTFIQPQPGEWTLLEGVLLRMFGEEQLQYVYGWIKVALDMFRECTWIAGQALFIAGPAGAGKNLFTELVRLIFGGRMPGKPYAFMTGRTEFNADFFGCELLTIEDEAESTDIRARRQFGARVKMVTANHIQWLHCKGKSAISMIPLWRVIASLNDDPERLLVVPPLDDDIADKIILLLVEKHKMPMPTKTPAQQRAFMAALVVELPAFLHFLVSWEIPSHLSSERYGITHYHHPRLAESLSELTPEQRLVELIDEVIFLLPGTTVWSGRSTELARSLRNDNTCGKEAERLLKSQNSCGIYLGRLARSNPARFSSRTLNGCTEWIINPPPAMVMPFPSSELIARVKNSPTEEAVQTAAS